MTQDATPKGFFSADHRACDAIWAEVEAAVDAVDEAKARDAWSRFSEAMHRHLRMEEEVLFPAFEQASGMHHGGPTFVMRAEHDQMRGLLSQMQQLADAGDLDGLLDQGDTLLMLIQQHNAKEEGMLYPMADRALSAEWPSLRDRLGKF